MALYHLSNAYLSLAVDTMGAELQSLYAVAEQREYIWQADAAYWGKHAPVLFPIVGALKGGGYTYKGQPFKLAKHGFARDQQFDLIAHEQARLQLLLCSSKETKKSYPFDFELWIEYQLKDDTLLCSYEVHNVGTAEMVFSLGAHPAFALPALQAGSPADRYLYFEDDAVLERYYLVEGLLSLEADRVLLDQRRLPLTASMFDQDAWIFKKLNSRRLTLFENVQQHRLELDFTSFDSLALWAVPGANFICIEPLCGYNDGQDATGRLEDKAGILTLAAGRKLHKSWSLRLGT